MTLLAVYNSEGCVGRCDARCYAAKHEGCDCVCGGRNHAAGEKAAIANTIANAERWVAEFRARGNEVDTFEIGDFEQIGLFG